MYMKTLPTLLIALLISFPAFAQGLHYEGQAEVKIPLDEEDADRLLKEPCISVLKDFIERIEAGGVNE